MAAEVAEVTEQEPSLEAMIGMKSKVAEIWVGTLSTCFNCNILGMVLLTKIQDHLF